MTNSEYTIPNEVADKWQEPFDDLLEQIYWEGYSHQLVEENPENYEKEFYYFIVQYDGSQCFNNGVPEAHTNPQGSGVLHE